MLFPSLQEANVAGELYFYTLALNSLLQIHIFCQLRHIFSEVCSCKQSYSSQGRRKVGKSDGARSA